MKRSGFTLIEVLIALAVFSVGTLSVVTIASKSQLLNNTGTVRTQAALLAQEGLESALAAGYSALPTDQLFLDESSLSAIGPEYSYFKRQVRVNYVDGSLATSNTDTGLKLITATITWDDRAKDGSNAAKSYTATTLMADL